MAMRGMFLAPHVRHAFASMTLPAFHSIGRTHMPTSKRAIILFAIATIAMGGCRDDMQPDDVSAPATAAPDPAMPAGDAAMPSTDAGAVPDAVTPDDAGPDNATQSDAAPGSADADRSFARSALASGIAEVKVSRDVEKRSPTSDVRALAKRIADDHEALNGKLRSFAGPDADAVDTDASAKAMDALIRSSEGADLDRAYLQHMVDGHARSIAKYEAAASTVRDDALRTLAKNALPKLREHARAVDAQLSRSK
jgi:putative membrane protein